MKFHHSAVEFHGSSGPLTKVTGGGSREVHGREVDPWPAKLHVATIAEYHAIETRLTARGFKPDTSPDAPICRWLKAGVTLDVMPSEPGVLSFHNRWYPLAVTTAQTVRLPSGQQIKLIDGSTLSPPSSRLPKAVGWAIS